jgi:hypothetical protein
MSRPTRKWRQRGVPEQGMVIDQVLDTFRAVSAPRSAMSRLASGLWSDASWRAIIAHVLIRGEVREDARERSEGAAERTSRSD